MNRITILTRKTGVPGVPAGEFSFLTRVDIEDLGKAEKATMSWLKDQPLGATVIRVESNVDAEYPDITLEAEIGDDGQVWWYVGPPPDRVVN